MLLQEQMKQDIFSYNEKTIINFILEKQEQIIEKNIIYQMNLLKRLRTNRKLISRSENLNFTLQKRPGIYRIDTQKCYTIDLKKEEYMELHH